MIASARPGVRAAADGRRHALLRSLHLTRVGCARVRGDTALLRRSGAGRAQERPWPLGSHWRVSRPKSLAIRGAEHDSCKILAHWLLRILGGPQNLESPYQTWWFRLKYVPVTLSIMNRVFQNNPMPCGEVLGFCAFRARPPSSPP